MGFYRALHINDLVTAIYTGSGEILYLIEGKERALLVDTSLGVRGLKELVHSLTYKPVTVALTHGHVDHALGAPEFEEVYLAPADFPLYRSRCPLEVRKEYLEGHIASTADGPKDEDFVPPCPEYPFRELEDGMVFDLGEVHVEAYALPGHTQGTFVFLLREYKILILGDACNHFTFLFNKEALSVEEYEENLKRMAEKLQGATAGHSFATAAWRGAGSFWRRPSHCAGKSRPAGRMTCRFALWGQRPALPGGSMSAWSGKTGSSPTLSTIKIRSGKIRADHESSFSQKE